ncbi:MAG: nucleotidyl transferase AbiEii/AbiGii toxin family protein [Gammaproteobacteria bacterium]|nr:nucleotidyl transferase AbiEii/AbiGii toxin family protein [Gammaproteobacteria bacterium]
MNQFAAFSDTERQELFQESSARLGIMPAIVEKDFWVTWILGLLFSNDSLSLQLMFKGGTSLSKVYGLIERFSEDIDLILDCRQLTDQDFLAQRSKTQDNKFSKELNELAQDYITHQLLTEIQNIIEPFCTASIDQRDPFVINVKYPGAFGNDYLRTEIRLEIGPVAQWNPHESREITSLTAQVFPNMFKQTSCKVNVILAKRTFWEKATILHAEAHRPESKILPSRYSRHYYDLAQMARSTIKEEALSDLKLLEEVVQFKQRFYPASWANYQSAMPGSFKLIPEQKAIVELSKDYHAMRQMIYGEYPDFKALINILQDLEGEING